MESKFRFEMEHEVTNRNEQEDEHRSSIINDKTPDVEMDCDNLEKEQEERKREDEARLKVIEQDLRTYGNVAPNVVKRMIESIRERFSQREKLIVENGNKIFELQLKNRITMREENKLSGRLLELRAQNTELRRKIDIKDKEMESMQRSLEQVDMKLNAKRLKKESEKVKVVAYDGNCCQHTGDFSPHRLLQNGSREIRSLQEVQVDRIENSRGRNQGTDQIFEKELDSVGTQESGFYGKNGLPVQTELSLLSQLYLEQNLPEPPKYTAEEDSVSMGAFERTFAMKFGRLSTEQQVTLLETKYLAEDETRRAKTRWELLRISENQSVEDFCLLLDEVARVAYRPLPPEELSSLKTAKLLEAIAGSQALRCMIDAKLLEYPEKEHYDISRLLAIRHEMSLKESREKREVRSERDGKMVTLDREVRKFSNVLPNCQSFPKVAVQCFKCGVYGHTIRVCPTLAEAPVQRNALKEPNLKVESIDI
uniref:CCHC-type domain-containing protein n=1 Tax=Caenorhabditis japonica TaxID=281687 RepID=A0A8R1EF86_CAEJA